MAPQNVLDLRVAIIGAGNSNLQDCPISQPSSNNDAGMGGLSTALALAKQGFTQIDVYESSSNLGFVGAGIQLAPNMARILDRLGVWKDIEAEAVDLKETFIRRQSPTTASPMPQSTI
jgi:ribulose 1,5-bisphosphate synthetase/thiazole synthase